MKNLKIKDVEDLHDGFLAVCEAVSQTLGAEGKYAVMENSDPYGQPIITKDGISVAKQIFFPDKFNNIGAFLAKQVAVNTLVKSGDSTTTSLVLSKAFLLEANGYFNKAVERGMDAGYKEVLEQIKELATPVNDQTLSKIAYISANNDQEIADIIMEAYSKVGVDGLIEVKENISSPNTTLTVNSGMMVSKGWKSPWFINNQNKATWEGEDVLVVSMEAYSADQALDNFLTENRFKEGNKLRPILIIMEQIADENFVQKLEQLAHRGVINCCLVQAPEFDHKRRALLEDIAIYTGGEVYVKGESEVIKAGVAKQVIVREDSTSIVIDNIETEAIKKRVSELKSQLETVKDKEFISKRIKLFNGASCLINVGGYTESESKERFDRVDDAIHAIRSAKMEGWIAGGGSTLAFISGRMKKQFLNKDEQYGYDLVKRVITAPLLQIVKNANRKHTTSFLKQGKDYLTPSKKRYGYGYNAKTDEISNLIEDGVIDSAKSIRVALDNAKSMASKLLNVGVVVTYNN